MVAKRFFHKVYQNHYSSKYEFLCLFFPDIGNDAKASNIQFPEVRANLRDIKRSFTDPINYTGETQAFSQRSLLWENAHRKSTSQKIKHFFL